MRRAHDQSVRKQHTDAKKTQLKQDKMIISLNDQTSIRVPLAMLPCAPVDSTHAHSAVRRRATYIGRVTSALNGRRSSYASSLASSLSCAGAPIAQGAHSCCISLMEPIAQVMTTIQECLWAAGDRPESVITRWYDDQTVPRYEPANNTKCLATR